LNFILLVGAGFSRNWGGWLASEAFEYLLGSRELIQIDRELLWRHKQGGFEAALSELQSGGSGSALRRMETALRQMFNDMNRGFFRDDFQFEFAQGQAHVGRFLARFDAIFSLNQDLLLEIGYCTNEPPQALNPRWSGFELPGMMQRVQPPNLDPRLHWASTWCPNPDSRAVQPSNDSTQPLYKLHGSSNWVDETGERLLVIGGNKVETIKGSRILTMYREEFARRLRQPTTRVMIIGYGFHDEHITHVLNEAAAGGELQSSIVDPAGADAPDPYRDRPYRLRMAGPEHQIQKVLIGASRRPLAQIFGGADTTEREKVLRFFEA
jgi:hypothetical protein